MSTWWQRPTRSVAFLVPGGLFLYVLLRPVSSNSVLVPVLAALGLCAAITCLRRRGGLSKPAVAILFLQFVHGTLSLLVGSVHDTPGLAAEGLVLLAAPALFWLCAAAVRPSDIRPILNVVAIGSIVVSGSILLYVLGAQGLVPSLPDTLLGAAGAGIGTNGETIAIRFYAISTLVAAAPMLTASIAMPVSAHLPTMRLRLVAAGLAVLATLLTGRRALVVALLMTPVILWLVKRLLLGAQGRRAPSSTRRVWTLAAPAALVLALTVATAVTVAPSVFSLDIIKLSVSSLSDTALGGGGAEGVVILQDESSRLITAWSDSPIFGHGAGATISGYSRDPLRPWNFELQYQRLLFYSGLVGLALFLATLAVSVGLLRRAVIASPDWSPALVVATVGAASMLLANASNPYLQAPGHMWSVYLPLAFANALLVHAGRTAKPTTDVVGPVLKPA